MAGRSKKWGSSNWQASSGWEAWNEIRAARSHGLSRARGYVSPERPTDDALQLPWYEEHPRGAFRIVCGNLDCTKDIHHALMDVDDFDSEKARSMVFWQIRVMWGTHT